MYLSHPEVAMSLFRRINYAAHELLADIGFEHQPSSGSISAQLWTECHDIAQAALESKFMQGLGNGTLDPNQYGQYIVQDCAYCAAAADDYKQVEILAEQQSEKTLATFAKAHYTSYESYVKTYLPSWHIGNADALVLNKAGKDYIAHERKAVTTLHPIYGLIAQIPCERLWPWLADQLKSKSSAGNVYQFWIDENYHYKHSLLLSNYMDDWFGKNPDQYNHDVALAVLRGSMIGELNMFRAACGQSLTTMPTIDSAD